MSNSQPAIVENFSSIAGSLDTQVEQLEQFQDQLEKYATQVGNMDSTEQSAFYNSATSIANRAEDIDTVDELLDLEDEIEEAIRSPLRQVARESIEELLVVIKPQLTQGTKGRIFEKLSDKLPSELETIGETHQDLISEVYELPAHLQDLVATQIEESPSHLLAPHEDIEPVVEALQEQHTLLKEVETAFQEAGQWAPAVEFTQRTELYDDASPRWDAKEVETELNKIQSKLKELPTNKLSLNDLVESELREPFEEFDLADTISNLLDVRRKLASIADVYNRLEEPYITLDDFGTSRGVFEERIDEFLAQYDQLPLNQYDSLEELEGSIEELNIDIDEFSEEVATRLRAQRKMVDTLQADSESDPPGITIGPGGDGLIMSVHVQENLRAALEDCEAHHEWIDAAIKTGSDEIDQEEMIGIWQRLSEGEQVPLSDDTEDAILALADNLSLGVVLRNE